MAKIRVYRDERKGDLFPARCLRCGKEPVEERTKLFVWNPGWAHLFIFLGLLPWLIALLITRKTMKVTVPMCPTHRNHWRNRQMYVWLGFVFWVVYAITLAIEWSDFPKEAANALLGILIFCGFIWLLAGLFYVNSGIKPSCITPHWAELVGVDKSFAKEWKEMEDEEDEKQKKWVRGRSGAYDD